MEKHSKKTQLFLEIPEAFYEQLDRFSQVTLFHQKPWHNFLKKTFGWQVSALVCFKNRNELGFFLPFISKRRFGKSINICLPFSHQIGPAYEPDFPPGAITLEEYGPGMEIHDRVVHEYGQYQENYFLSILELSKYAGIDELFSAFNESSIQRKIKKAQKSSLGIVKGFDPDQLDEFSRLQSLTRWRQGSPTYPAMFFRNMAEELGKAGQIQLYLAFLEGRAVGGTLFLYDRNQGFYGYGASVNDREVWKLGVNQLTMWEAIKDAFQKGCTRVDFGRTPSFDLNLLTYKEKWGAVSTPLTYTYIGHNNKIHLISRDSALIDSGSQILRRMPYPLFRVISPILLKQAI